MSENEKLQKDAKAAKPAKSKSESKNSKPGFFARIGKWFKDMKSELKKVVWPTGKQTANNTVVVIVCCIVVGICIWVFDAVCGGVISALLALFGKG